MMMMTMDPPIHPRRNAATPSSLSLRADGNVEGGQGGATGGRFSARSNYFVRIGPGVRRIAGCSRGIIFSILQRGRALLSRRPALSWGEVAGTRASSNDQSIARIAVMIVSGLLDCLNAWCLNGPCRPALVSRTLFASGCFTSCCFTTLPSSTCRETLFAASRSGASRQSRATCCFCPCSILPVL